MRHKRVLRRLLPPIVILMFLVTGTFASITPIQDPTGRPEGSSSKKKKVVKEKPKVAPEPITVILTVITDPPGSEVLINGRSHGTSDAEGKIQLGRLALGGHSIEVRKEGYSTAYRSFLAGSESPTVVVKLTPALDDVLKQFRGLLDSGRLIGPELPNALDVLTKSAARFGDRPEIAQMRSLLAAKLRDSAGPVISRTLTDWRTITREELTRARGVATTLAALDASDKQANAHQSYLNAMIAVYDWQAGLSSIAGSDLAVRTDGASNWQTNEATGGLPRAKTELQKAIEHQESWALAWLKLGNVLLYSGEFGAAESAFVKTAQLEPRWAVAQTGLGAAYYAGRKYKEAIAAYQKAVELDPRSVDGFAGLGLSRAANRDIAAGTKDVQRAMEIDPNAALPHFHLGIIYSLSKKEKDLLKAGEELRKAVQMNSRNLEFQNRIAEQMIGEIESKTKKRK